MEIHRNSSTVPASLVENRDCSLVREEPKPAVSFTAPLLTHSIAFERFTSSNPLTLLDSEELFNIHQTEVSKKKLAQDSKKKSLLIASFKQMANALGSFQSAHNALKERIATMPELPAGITAYASTLSTLETFNQKVFDILTSEEKCNPKLKKLAALYNTHEATEMLQFLETHSATLKKTFPHDPFVYSLQQHIFTHSAFLKKLYIYEPTEQMDKALKSYQGAVDQLPINFLRSCEESKRKALNSAAEKFSIYLQLNSNETISYEDARTTLMAHYGRRVVDEVELGFPANFTQAPISAARFREMLVSVALRVKKEDLVALYNTLKGNLSEELFACTQNIAPAAIAHLKTTGNFDTLNDTQLMYLVTAFRSYKDINTESVAEHANKNQQFFSIKPIGKKLVKDIPKNLLSPITDLALKFLAASKRAETYIQNDDSPDYNVRSKYASREHLAREMAYALDFSGNKGTIFQSVTTNNTLSFSYLADTLCEEGIQAYLVCPLTNDPKGSLISLLFGGFKHCGISEDEISTQAIIKAGGMIFAGLKKELWKMFVCNIPKSPQHIEVDAIGYDLGAHNAMLFSEYFAMMYFCQGTPDAWYDLSTKSIVEFDALACLTNIKLLQVWAMGPRTSSLINCSEYNFRKHLLQQMPSENRPLIAHHYLLTANFIPPDLKLYGWVDPSLPDSQYAQDPAKTWSYKDKEGREHQIQDTDLLVASQLDEYSFALKTFLPNLRCTPNCVQYGGVYLEFNEVPPEEVNNHLGSNPLIVAIANTAFTLIKRNVWDNLSLPRLLSNIVSRPSFSPYSFISTSAVQG